MEVLCWMQSLTFRMRVTDKQTDRTLARDTGRRRHRDTETERVYTKLSCGDSGRRKGTWRGGALENGRQEQLIVSVCVIV